MYVIWLAETDNWNNFNGWNENPRQEYEYKSEVKEVILRLA